MRFDNLYDLEYSDYFPHLYFVSADVPFDFLRVFLFCFVLFCFLFFYRTQKHSGRIHEHFIELLTKPF